MYCNELQSTSSDWKGVKICVFSKIDIKMHEILALPRSSYWPSFDTTVLCLSKLTGRITKTLNVLAIFSNVTSTRGTTCRRHIVIFFAILFTEMIATAWQAPVTIEIYAIRYHFFLRFVLFQMLIVVIIIFRASLSPNRRIWKLITYSFSL